MNKYATSATMDTDGNMVTNPETMPKYKYVATVAWIKVLKPIWSMIINCFYWLFRPHKIAQTRRAMQGLKKMSLNNVMAMFRWREDNFKDWTPWVMTIIANEMQDDCDGAATLARWRLRQDSIKARIVHLYSVTDGHTVCLSSDNSLLVTNNLVLPLAPATWRTDLLAYFQGKYNIIID